MTKKSKSRITTKISIEKICQILKQKKIWIFCWYILIFVTSIFVYALIANVVEFVLIFVLIVNEWLLNLKFVTLRKFDDINEKKKSIVSNQIIYNHYKNFLSIYTRESKFKNFKLLKAIWRKSIDQLLQKIQYLNQCKFFSMFSYFKFNFNSMTKFDRKINYISINYCINYVNKF